MEIPYFVFGGGEEPTPEQRAEQARIAEQHKMRIQEFQHSHQRLFEELDKDQLQSLQAMFQMIAANTGDRAASHWEGMASMALKIRFGVCVTCGVNHDEELLEDKSETVVHNFGGTAEKRHYEINPDALMRLDGELEKDVQPSEDQPLPQFKELSDEERSNMEKYHLDDARVEGSGELVGFICTGIIGGPKNGCGMIYQSIEDRMLRDPENCSGCFIKAAQG